MDDLSGLDWSANASGNKPKPMAANPSYPPYRSSPSPFGTGQSTPLSAQQSNNSVPKAAPAKVAQDSFSNLSFGLPKATQKLSLAERQAQLEAEKRKKEEERRKLAEAQFGNGQHWDALGSRGFTPSPVPQQHSKILHLRLPRAQPMTTTTSSPHSTEIQRWTTPAIIPHRHQIKANWT